MQNRENVLNIWIKHILSHSSYQLTPLTGDASFRRYYRLAYDNKTRIVMDAPPEKESVVPFMQVANTLSKTKVCVPKIHAFDTEQGFLILDDFGDTLVLPTLTLENVHTIYQSAFTELLKIQQCETNDIPSFDKAHMMQEMGLFKTWFLEQYLNVDLSTEDLVCIEKTMEFLADTLSKQPQVFIHRDYHSRNLMLLHSDTLGVLDFQDAMLGPATYDLVSLLKDCYIVWPRQQVLDWACIFHAKSPHLSGYDKASFIKAFDLCGLQRHLKVLGIFCRLAIRDHKPGYLKDLPLTLQYTKECASLYPELAPLYTFLNEKVQLP